MGAVGYMETGYLLEVIAGLLLVCVLCQWIAWRVKLPAILFLLLAGIAAGPLFRVLQPDRLLGDFLFPFVSLSVAIILFEGGLTLRLRDIAGLQSVVQRLISIGMLMTWGITAVATRHLVGLSWEISLLFGAITVVTGPTVIAPMIRTVRPKQTISDILRWEGITIDPIGATMAVLVYEFVLSLGAGEAWLRTLLTFGSIVVIGLSIGAVSGHLLGLSIRNHWLPEFMQNMAVLSSVILAYVLSDVLQAESGLLTVTVMGMWLANMRDVDVKALADFKESISLLLISILFVMLASRLDLTSMSELGLRVAFVLLAIQFFARPLNVMVATAGSGLTWPERHMLAWIAPRGIIAAAVSALFAVKLEGAGFSDARFLVPLTFSVIIFTVVLQSITARPIARFLKVAEPEPTGFLVVGANPVARAIGKVLKQSGVRVLLADYSRDEIDRAEVEGLATYFGNPMSEHADRSLDLVGIGRMLALSPYEDLNVSAAMHFGMELGRQNVYVIQSHLPHERPDHLKMPTKRLGGILFGAHVTYSTLDSILSQGARFRTVLIDKEGDDGERVDGQYKEAIPLFAMDPKGRVHVFHEGHHIHPRKGWSMILLDPRGGKG